MPRVPPVDISNADTFKKGVDAKHRLMTAAGAYTSSRDRLYALFAACCGNAAQAEHLPLVFQYLLEEFEEAARNAAIVRAEQGYPST